MIRLSTDEVLTVAYNARRAFTSCGLDDAVVEQLMLGIEDVVSMALEVATPGDKGAEAPGVLEAFAYIREKTGKRHPYSVRSKGAAHVRARLAEGFSLQDVKDAIDNVYRQWHRDPRMSKFIRLQTICQPTKFTGYLSGLAGGHDDEDADAGPAEE